MTQDLPHITRSNLPLAFEGIRAPTLQALRNALSRCGAPEKWLVTDLSLGAWRSHQAASELYGQLGLNWQLSSLDVAQPLASPRSCAQAIARFIDAEARGDRATLEAWQFATNVYRAIHQRCLRRSVLVFLPRGNLPWEPQDWLFLSFLAQGLGIGPSRLFLVSTDETCPSFPEDCDIIWQNESSGSTSEHVPLLAMVPGLLPSELVETAQTTPDLCPDILVPLECGKSFLIPPEFRRLPGRADRLDHDKLAVVMERLPTEIFGWVTAYAQVHGNNIFVRPQLLAAQAIRLVDEGGTGVALRLLDHAVACAHDISTKWELCALASGIRIALQQFDAVGQAPPVPNGLMPWLRRFLHLTAGWSLVMKCPPDPVAALSHFERAVELIRPEDENTPDHFYLLNIKALAHFRNSEFDTARAIEHVIERGQMALPQRDWCLEYVNSINLARLYRHSGELEQALRYFQRAFETTEGLGVRSESDLLYMNVCLARIDERRGKYSQAFSYWLRAALHWVSFQVPEALAPRARRALLDDDRPRGDRIGDHIACLLFDSICNAGEKAGFSVDFLQIKQFATRLAPPPFFRLDELAEPTITMAVWASDFGVGILVSPTLRQAFIQAPEHARLRSLLWALFVRQSPPLEKIGTCSVFVDTRFGREIPSSPCELLDSTVRLRIRQMFIGHRLIEIDDTWYPRLGDSLIASVAGSIAAVEIREQQAVVTFKRSRSPYPLPLNAASLLMLLQGNPHSIADLRGHAPSANREDFLGLLRSLERAGLIHLTLDALPPFLAT